MVSGFQIDAAGRCQGSNPAKLRLRYESTEVHLVRISLSCNDNLNHEISDNNHKVLTDQPEEIIKVDSSTGISK